MPKTKDISKSKYDADLKAANKQPVLTPEDVSKNKLINFMSFFNFQLDVLKSNLVMPLNNIDKITLKQEFKDDNEHVKPLLDNLTNLGQEVIKFVNDYIKWDKK